MMYYTGIVLDQTIVVPNPPVQQVYSHERYHNTNNITSHLVKHTDIIPSLSTSIRVVVVVMELWTTHPTKARFAHVSRTAWTHVSRRRHPCRATGTSHMRVMPSVLNCLTVIDFGHPPNTSAPQSRILIAVSPAVNGSLNQSSLAAKTGVQLGQSPSNSVAFSFVNQTVSTVLVLAATSPWINAILSLELWA